MRFYPALLALPFLFSSAYAHEGAASVPAAAASVAPAATNHHFHINRFVLGTGVQNKEPQNVKTAFDSADHHVFTFLDLSTHEGGSITVHWKRDGHDYYSKKLDVKASNRFRTWASVKALPGNWTVAVQDEQGHVLQELNFTVGGGHGGETAHAADVAHTQKAGIKDVLTSLEPQKTDHK